MYSKELIRGMITPVILRLLYPDNSMYGYQICQKVKELTNQELLIREGTLYPALHKLLDEGLICVEEVITANRPRRYYRLTAEGKLQAEQKTSELRHFLKTMQLFIDRSSLPT